MDERPALRSDAVQPERLVEQLALHERIEFVQGAEGAERAITQFLVAVVDDQFAKLQVTDRLVQRRQRRQGIGAIQRLASGGGERFATARATEIGERLRTTELDERVRAFQAFFQRVDRLLPHRLQAEARR